MTTSTTQNDRSDAASVARRPDALLSRDDTARLSVRSDAIGLAYFFGHFGLIDLGGWLTWQTFPSSASYVPVLKRGLMVIEARILMALYGAIIIAAVVTGFGLALVICWLIPRFLGEPIQRIVRVAEHAGCEESPDLLNNTRTTLTFRWLNAIA